MMEIKEEDIELQQKLRKVAALVSQAKKSSSHAERDPLLEKCDRDLTQCTNIIRRIEIETRDMNPDNRAQVRTLLKERAGRLKELKNDYKWIKNDNNQFNDVSEREMKYQLEDNLVTLEEDKLMEYGRNIQQEDANILDRVILDVDQTQAQAADVAQKVAAQTDQIRRVDKNLDEIDDELERAKRILRMMLRRVMTDKIVWCFLGFIIIAVLIIIVLHLVGDPDADKSAAEQLSDS